MESDLLSRRLPCKPTTDGDDAPMENSSSSPDWANFDRVRRCLVEDFRNVSSSGAVSAVVSGGGCGLERPYECWDLGRGGV